MTVVVVPWDAGIGTLLGQLEDRLLWNDSESDAVHDVAEAATHAIGRLASKIAGADRSDPATMPMDGDFELGPLTFVPVTTEDVAAINALAELVTARPRAITDFEDVDRRMAARAAALVNLPVDDDVQLLSRLLARPAAADFETERVELTAEEVAAYRRVVERALAVWLGPGLDRSLARFAAMGDL